MNLSNSQYLGKYIEQVVRINSDLEYGLDDVRGCSNTKQMMSTRANMIGRTFEKFYIVTPGEFVFNRRTTRNGEKIGMAYNNTDRNYIFTNDYVVFRVREEYKDVLLSDYLYLFFCRSEFDRYARYKSTGSATEFFNWEDMCAVPFKPIPMTEQKRIVKAYKVLTDRIELKKKINDNLAETMKAIFKSWFLDFSAINNMETVQSQYGLIPKGWRYELLGNLCKCVTKGTTPTTLGKDFTEAGINFIKGESINDDHSFNKALFSHIDDETDELLKRSRIYENDIIFTIAGTLGKFALVDSSVVPANTNQAVAIIRTSKIAPQMLYSYFIGEWQVEFYRRNTQQAVQANLSLGTIKELPILLPNRAGQARYMQLVNPLITGIKDNFSEIERLYDLQNQLLARLSRAR